mmetsp:Transcript_24140/g.42850  ORF Transcript_24140/g.42850 Transcript_24140/m.42850 type:complete len:356 (+) Transcript_24140:175-1242(+)
MMCLSAEIHSFVLPSSIVEKEESRMSTYAPYNIVEQWRFGADNSRSYNDDSNGSSFSINYWAAPATYNSANTSKRFDKSNKNDMSPKNKSSVKSAPKKAISATRRLATRNKPASSRPKTTSSSGTPDQAMLSRMLELYEEHDQNAENAAVSFATIMQEFGMNDRNTGWRNHWKDLVSKGYIASVVGDKSPMFTSDYMFTEQGLQHVADSDAYSTASKMDKGSAAPKTNEDLHERIKSKLMNKRGQQIFDLLLKKGTMSRKDLSTALKISDRGAYFSYALLQLKELQYVEIDPKYSGKSGKKLRLTEKAFLPGQREQWYASLNTLEESLDPENSDRTKKEGDEKPADGKNDDGEEN